MKQEINPQDTIRAEAFKLWMNSPMPMVTLTKTFNVTRMYRKSKKQNVKFNMLLCWCIGKAASRIEEFYLIPESGKLYKYDSLAINVIVKNKQGGISNCDIPYCDNMAQFSSNYDNLTQKTFDTAQNININEAAVIGTSAVTSTFLDSIVNQYTGIYNNPFLSWGRYKQHWLKTVLPISLQFHHAQMDGEQAAQFLNNLQEEMNKL